MKLIIVVLLLSLARSEDERAESYVWRTCEGYQPTWEPVRPWTSWCRKLARAQRPPANERRAVPVVGRVDPYRRAKPRR